MHVMDHTISVLMGMPAYQTFPCQLESTAPQLIFVMWHYFGLDHQGQGGVIESRIQVTSNDCDFIFKFLPSMRMNIGISRVDLIEYTILSQTRAQQ